MRIYRLIPAVFFIAFMPSCEMDKIDPCPTDCSTKNITYNNYIKNLVDTNCASSGCHDGTNAPGAKLDNYAAVQSIVANGSFTQEVLVSREMPKGFELRQGQLDSIKCWICNGNPQ